MSMNRPKHEGSKRKPPRKSKVRKDDEKVPVPTHRIGRVIGTQGAMRNEIKRETGAVVIVEDDTVYVRGTEEQRQNARSKIQDIVQGAEPGKCRCLTRISPGCFPVIIGKGGANLKRVQNQTNTRICVIKDENVIKIYGDEEGQRKAAIKIKEQIAALEFSKAPVRKFVHMEALGLSEDHEFMLKKVSGPTEEKRYRIYSLEHHDLPNQGNPFSQSHNVERLKSTVLEILRKVREADDIPAVDMWCHFGKSCIKGVEEADEDKVFTLTEIKEKLGIPPQAGAYNQEWKTSLDVGVEEIEVESLEESLAKMACSPKYDFRHDFSFYTPTCREIRVKVWLVGNEDDGQGEEGAASMSFARNAPVPVNNLRYQKLPEEDGVSYSVCVPFQYRMKVDILLPSCPFDCRLLIRTTKDSSGTSPEDKEEDLILEDYLNKMTIQEGKLVLPPEQELEDFDLYFRRISHRRTYRYESAGEKFSLTVCKDEPLKADGTPDSTAWAKKMDVHLHCDEWDRVLSEGVWEPEEIVAKFSEFLKFISRVQSNYVKPAVHDEG